MTNRTILRSQVEEIGDISKSLKNWQIKLVNRHLSNKKNVLVKGLKKEVA